MTNQGSTLSILLWILSHWYWDQCLEIWNHEKSVWLMNCKWTLLVILAEVCTISCARTSTEFVRLVPTDASSTSSSEENATLTVLTSVVERLNIVFETGFCPISKTTRWQLPMKSWPLVILLLLWSALRNLVEIMSAILSRSPSTAALFWLRFFSRFFKVAGLWLQAWMISATASS